MKNKIEASVYFSTGIQQTVNGPALSSPFRVIPTPFMPTLLSMAITFIITGLDNKTENTFQVTLRRKDSQKIIYQSKEEKFKYSNPYNTVVNIVLDNTQFNQTTGGDYEAVIEIKDNEELIFKDKGIFTIIKTK